MKKMIKKFPITREIYNRYTEVRSVLKTILHGNNTLLVVNQEMLYKLNTLLKISVKPIENELSVLCDLYGTDKGSLFRNVHTYTKVYQSLFSPIKNNVKAVLECGIGRVNPYFPSNLGIYPNPGASLRVWRDFFTNAVIIGGDINCEVLFDEDRVHAAYLDQLSPLVIKRFFKYFVPKHTDFFDIIIDNGLHTFDAAVCLFENSFQYLATGGLYIIEDMHSVKDIPRFVDYFNNCVFKEQMTVRFEILEKVSLANDNNLIIITKI